MILLQVLMYLCCVWQVPSKIVAVGVEEKEDITEISGLD